ncbi:hypothetical protein [Hymenobacter arcticus]
MVLTGEMQGAGINTSYRWVASDACTGAKLTADDELDPHRLEAFRAEANIRLRQQLEAYITECGPQGRDPLLSEEDISGLRSQQFELDPEQLKLADGQVVFPPQVSYDMLSSFLRKEYAGWFGAAFSFAEVRTFLRLTSPLHWLVLPVPISPASPRAKPTIR